MTPLSGLTPIYHYFLGHNNPGLKAKQRVFVVSSETNPFINQDWILGMTEEEYRLRVLGSFESPTGLVYNQFHRSRNVIDPFDVDELPGAVHYRSIDFGVDHPTGAVFLSRDDENNIFVW